VPTRYLYRGIVVQGKHFPISVLQWIEGESLEAYVLHHFENPDQILALSENFRLMCRQLEECGMAHGDLSHRNIIIKSDEIFLIDYDGMFVPALSSRKSSELGNIHFQHPLRSNAYFNCHLDRFASIVIYLALLGLASDPSLWVRFQSGGEGLIFQKADFLNPRDSRLLQLLEKFPLTSRYIPRFRQICQSSIEEIPSIEELISQHTYVAPAYSQLWDFVDKRKPDIPVLEAVNPIVISKIQGEIATIVGKVTEVFHGQTKDGEDHIFVNFGDWQNDCFTGVFWGSILEDLQKADLSIDTWVGEWTSVSGLVSVYKNRPQIQVDTITDCVLLNSEDKAKSLLIQYSKTDVIKKKKPTVNSVNFIDHKNNKFITESVPPQKSTKIINLSDMFQNRLDSSVDEAITQIYSSGKFKTRRKKADR
jgi:hypothetical protein